MKIKQKIFYFMCRCLKMCIWLLGERNTALVSAFLAESLPPILTVKTKVGAIQFYCPGKISYWRAETLLTKEPDTIEWIDAFEKGSVFWDIGANVGEYALYAALKPNSNVKVMAFEPAATNYNILTRNIEINKMDNKISALCVAFNDITCLDYFYMSSTEAGCAHHGFCESIDWHGKQFTAKFKQGMLGFSIDEFILHFNPPFPNHIKIDVDGIENKIIKGAEKTIRNRRLKSLLVELDIERQDYSKDVIVYLEDAGLKLMSKKNYGTCNHIFVRSD